MIQQVKDDNGALEKQQQELTYKLAHRNDLLQRLSAETAKLKAKFEEKLLEIQRLTENSRNLQDALASSETAYEQLRVKSEDTVGLKTNLSNSLSFTSSVVVINDWSIFLVFRFL